MDVKESFQAPVENVHLQVLTELNDLWHAEGPQKALDPSIQLVSNDMDGAIGIASASHLPP